MDLESYVLETNSENFIEKLESGRDEPTQINACTETHIYPEKWEFSKDVKSPDLTKAMVSVTEGSFPKSEEFPSSLSHKVENRSTDNQKGRASLVRLQAAVQTPPSNATTPSLSDSVKSGEPGISSAESSHNLPSSSSELPVTSKSGSWATGDESGETGPCVPDMYYLDAGESRASSSILNSDTPTSPSDSVPNQQQMQRFLTSDGQYVYGYKDSAGEFHFFYPTLDERESHNEKERKRRSRVSEACSHLRRLVPGLTEKTDKASVFEQAALYLQFLRDKYGTQFDQMYYEKHYIETT